MNIKCDDCVMQDTTACDDCVVSFVVSREPGDALVIDVEEERAVRLLQRAGLVPVSRHVAR
jgi:hypothetical protein